MNAKRIVEVYAMGWTRERTAVRSAQGRQQTVVSPVAVAVPDNVGDEEGQVPEGAGLYVPYWLVPMGSGDATPQDEMLEFRATMPEQPETKSTLPPHFASVDAPHVHVEQARLSVKFSWVECFFV